MLIVFEFVVIVIGTVESVFNENGVFETISAANVIFAGWKNDNEFNNSDVVVGLLPVNPAAFSCWSVSSI